MAGLIPQDVKPNSYLCCCNSSITSSSNSNASFNVGPLRDLLGMLPGTVEVVDAHAENQVGGAIVIALITVLAAALAPHLCPLLGM